MTASDTPDLAKQPLRCGVLIVGSLLWKQDQDREVWRDNRLDLTGMMHVNAPLRYGRRSQTWGDTFTMILDPGACKGQALLAPCKAGVRSFADLLDEVRWLWSAEDNKPLADRFHKGWGCVATLFGTRATAAGIHERWKRHFQAAKPSIPCSVDKEGQLQIPWPRTLDGAIATSVDIILATATMPNPMNERPSPRDVAKAWADQKVGHERYFLENVRHGIRTGDDAEIWLAIEKAQPEWLRSEEYADVICKLRRQIGQI